MKSSTVALALMASIAIAQPHRQHVAKHQHQKRSQPIVWVTEWDIATETVPVTTTIWVSEGFVPPTTTKKSKTSSSSSAGSPAQFYQGASAAPKLSSSSSSSVYVAPIPIATTSTTSYKPVAIPTVAPPVKSSTSTTSTSTTPTPTPTPKQVKAPQPTPEAIYTPPTTTSSNVASTTSSQSESGSGSGSVTGSTTGDCANGSTCSGDLTHYDPSVGTGACGWDPVDGSKNRVMALPHGFMGLQSNGNPFCGKSVTIEYKGKKTTCKVVDKCMGCEGRSIDISDQAFSDLMDLGVGRAEVNWWFN